MSFMEYRVVNTLQREWIGSVFHFKREFIFLVPIGYDGHTRALYNPANIDGIENPTLSDYLDSDSLIIKFR